MTNTSPRTEGLPPVGVQLYSVRRECARDFEGTVREIARMGYNGVETAGFGGTTPEKAARLFTELELSVPSMHIGLPADGNWEPLAATAALFGCTSVITSAGPADKFADPHFVRDFCKMYNDASAAASRFGLHLGLHNHWWEFAPSGDRLAFDIMRECLSPSVFFEIDVYWARTAGQDPAALVRALGDRAPILHIKDGPCKPRTPMTAVGKGIVDVPSILDAAAGNARWLIVELDNCATSMMEAVHDSIRYLRSLETSAPTR